MNTTLQNLLRHNANRSEPRPYVFTAQITPDNYHLPRFGKAATNDLLADLAGYYVKWRDIVPKNQYAEDLIETVKAGFKNGYGDSDFNDAFREVCLWAREHEGHELDVTNSVTDPSAVFRRPSTITLSPIRPPSGFDGTKSVPVQKIDYF